MTGLGAGFILLFLLLYQTRTCHCNYADILWGQCYAFCLAQHESRLHKGGEDDVDYGLTIKKCRRDKICKWCLHACERPRKEYQDQTSCFVHCQKTRPRDNLKGRDACNESCSFIHQSISVKYGSCPRFVDDGNNDGNDKDVMSGGVVSDGVGNDECRDQCQRDVDCDNMLKCCTGGCSKKCLRTVEWNFLPPVPDSLRFKTRRDGSTMIEWKKAMLMESTKPIIYVLRWWCSYTDGVISSLTTKLRLRLKGYNHSDGLHPGQPCHFMLAAVNKYGSQGFSSTQQYTKKFIRPSKPVNLETVRSKLQNEKVDITIQWQPPIYTDNLPIAKYLVLWSDPLPRAIPEYERRHMHNKTLDGDKTSYTIAGLEQGLVYFVQVRAVVNWKKRSIRGDPVSTYLETYSVPRPVEPVEPGGFQGGSAANSVIFNVTVSKPGFVQSQLKAWVTWHVRSGLELVKYMLYWVPDICEGEAQHRKTKDRLENEATTHKKEFLLYNLVSSCVYELRIHSVNYHGEIDAGRRELFQTPPCMETQGAQSDLCSTDVLAPLNPKGVSIRFKTSSSCVCQAVISWMQASSDHNKNKDDHQPVSGWNIIWGQSRRPAAISSSTGSNLVAAKSYQSATIVYNTLPYETQVPGKETKACLTYLENSKHYTVQIIGQTENRKGEPAVFHFVTPDYMPKCYTDLEGLEGSSGEEGTTQDNLVISSETQADSSHGNTSGAPSYHQKWDYKMLFITVIAVWSSSFFLFKC